MGTSISESLILLSTPNARFVYVGTGKASILVLAVAQTTTTVNILHLINTVEIQFQITSFYH